MTLSSQDREDTQFEAADERTIRGHEWYIPNVSQHVLLQVQSGCVYRGKAMFLVVGRMSMVFRAAGSPLLQTRLVQLNRSN
jgi:hypothetical protein